jgi:predicted ferric reductase
MTTLQNREYQRIAKRRWTSKDFVEFLIPFTTALAVALFFGGGGFTNFLDVATIPFGVGVVSGLIGTNLFLVMMVLAARIPFVDNLFGHDRALELHKKLGKPVLYLLLVHMVALIVDYASRVQTDLWSEVVTMFGISDLLLSFLAMGVMVLIVITSLVAVKKALPHGVWHTIHLMSYVAMFLGVFHQFSQGMMFAEGTMARWYWLSLYVVAVGGIAIFRVIIPVAKSMRHKLVVDEVVVEGPGTVSITMRGRDLDRAGFRSGNFAQWRFLARGLWTEAHPFSISAAPTRDRIRITVRDLGDATKILQNVRPGTGVWFEGPYGVFTDEVRTTSRVALIGSGIGLAPIRALVESIDVAPGDLTVIARAHTDEEMFLIDEIIPLAHQKRGTVYKLAGKRGVRTSWLPWDESERGVTIGTIIDNPKTVDYFLCGPEHWMEALITDLERAGVPAHQIHFEKFAW